MQPPLKPFRSTCLQVHFRHPNLQSGESRMGSHQAFGQSQGSDLFPILPCYSPSEAVNICVWCQCQIYAKHHLLFKSVVPWNCRLDITSLSSKIKTRLNLGFLCRGLAASQLLWAWKMCTSWKQCYINIHCLTLPAIY